MGKEKFAGYINKKRKKMAAKKKNNNQKVSEKRAQKKKNDENEKRKKKKRNRRSGDKTDDDDNNDGHGINLGKNTLSRGLIHTWHHEISQCSSHRFEEQGEGGQENVFVFDRKYFLFYFGHCNAFKSVFFSF